MTSYETLRDLQAAYKSGAITDPLMLDNDSASVYVQTGSDMENYEGVFEMHPDDVMEQALDLLGIPHEHV